MTASRKNCEIFVRNLLDGERKVCFHCGLDPDNHEKQVLMASNDQNQLPQPQEAKPNPQQKEAAANAQQHPEVVIISSDSDSEGEPEGLLNKIRRPRFSPEQLQQMIPYGHRLGWRLQPHKGNPDVQRFCDTVGISRTQLRGWLWKNKHKYQQVGGENNV
uniref:Homeobox domain-containing protein n=1 Tax=Kalanchoe fedtschenkoi TaxID=63787 RepID=A0A7N0UK36_KALFE